ncbi:MAG: DUF1707 domain-containing protein [Actinomycetota bacterium]|nr:DUF1707 domain-containing protein [Actinomycetota bacterium]
MGGSTPDTPTTPESLRVSDAERDHAVDELRDEFAEGRLSHETFVYRMQTALDARNHRQLANLFTDLPPRRGRLLARIRTALRRLGVPAAGRGYPAAGGDRPARSGEYRSFPGPAQVTRNGGAVAGPAPLFFPPGRGDRFTIGRTRDCDLCLADLSVSRRHAELVRRPDGWLLSDLGSHNGTRLNGWLVRETVPVRAGDRLEFGSAVFVILDNPHGQIPGD